MANEYEQLPLEPPQRVVFSVSALNQKARQTVESALGTVWVEGEISNLARPASGHMYWSLKDSHAQVRCAMFRQYGRQLGFVPRNGLQVTVRAQASIYEARGDYQLIVDYMEEAGEGLLRRKFEQLKARLEAEGSFAAERKQLLPELPNRIGVITSASGAAVHDVITALRRRFPAIPVLIYPSPVQGEGSAEKLAAALDLANARKECDLIILTRGGGSLEDLWAFNEEVLARAIVRSALPVISGVGHETDFTIADFVADLRAPTPSQAAELAVPNQAEYVRNLHQMLGQMGRAMRHRLAQEFNQFTILEHRLERTHPGYALRERAQRVDDAERALHDVLKSLLAERQRKLQRLELRLTTRNPAANINLQSALCDRFGTRMHNAIRRQLETISHRIGIAEKALQALSPLATLDRGYAIVTASGSGQVISNANTCSVGDQIDVRLHCGRLEANITAADATSKAKPIE